MAGTGDRPFRTGLSEREIPYVVQVKTATSVHAVDTPFELPTPTRKKGRPLTKPSYQTKPVQAKRYAAGEPEPPQA